MYLTPVPVHSVGFRFIIFPVTVGKFVGMIVKILLCLACKFTLCCVCMSDRNKTCFVTSNYDKKWKSLPMYVLAFFHVT